MWFKKKDKNTEVKMEAPKTKVSMEKVFTDKFGNNWYQYKNMLEIPAKRAIAAEVATRFADMNVTKPVLKDLIEQMRKFANSGDIVALFGLLNELEFRMDFMGEEKTLTDLALCYFVIEGEDETDFSEAWKEKKREILENDSDAHGFFLSMAYQLTMNFSNTYETDILEYLRENKLSEMRLRQILHHLKSADTLTKSTT